MKNENGEIVWISVPFVSGVAAADWLCSVVPSWALAAGSLAAAGACILAGSLLEGRRNAVLSALFLFLGVLCRSCALPVPAAASFRLPAMTLDRFTALLQSIPFERESSRALVIALLTGQRGGLSAETLVAFRQSGASHILALSGLHLGIIYSLLRHLLRLLGNSRLAWTVRSAVTVLVCGFYALMTGAGASIVRALLFVVLRELSSHNPGRNSSAVSVWCTAIMVQLLFCPGAVSGVGFRLSYLSMLGIHLLFPVLRGFYPGEGRFDPLRRIWEAMALSVSCQAFTAPLVWATFHTFPKHFLLTNLIALPLTEALVVCSLAAAALLAFGACPEPLFNALDLLCDALGKSLSVIAGM